MSKRLISFVLVLGLVLTGMAGAADPDLVGHWKFDDGSGTVAVDSSGNGNDGVFVGDPKWVPGHLGGALEFDGDDYLDCGNDPSLEIRDAITISFWFKVEAFQNTWEAFFSKGDTAYRASRGGGSGNATHLGISGTGAGGGSGWFNGVTIVTGGEWHHFAGTYDGTAGRIYIDGVLDAESPASGQINIETDPLWIANNSQNTGRQLHGLMDDVRLYSRALNEVEILGVMAGGGAEYPLASGPTPENGALHADTWANLSWRAGDFAVSHDVYFGDNFDDVNAGAESTFQGSQGDTFFVVGFPGFPFPDGLVPGTTYYWRIDEVNDTEPNSPWKGDVWSFMIPPKSAYNPGPADGSKFIDSEIDLSWTAGFGAKLHTVYFGDNFDDVNNAAGGSPQGQATYDPGTLELKKTYYWRVDEFDAFTTHKGNVWSFTTAGEGGGIKAEFFSGMDFGGLVLTRTDPQVNFNWGNAEPDPAVGFDNFSVRWTGEVEAAFTETYTFYTNTDDGARLWVDGQQLVNDWNDHGATENRGTIDLVAGNTYSIIMEYYENGGGAVAELRWSSPRTPKDLIPQAALSLPVKAGNPNPSNNAVDVSQRATLSWSPGEAATSHDVYFGTDADAVKNADTSSSEYKGSRQLDSESYDPGQLEWDTTYYWRVDEVEADGTIQTGNIWSFTTANFIIVDDIESYNYINEGEEGSNRIYNAWLDGYDDPTNGSQTGHLDAPFYEEATVHGGNKSMPLYYDNAVGKSEATLTLTYPRDWTENGVDTLTIWYVGDAANAAETMYVVLNGTAGVDNPDANAAQAADWTEWKISLQDFGTNLTNVNTITIGFGNRTNPTAGGAGMVFFDDIRLLLPTP
ncbi:MAG: LamG-like jellyroll fold domain-containing protein [Planctomycetota bacterium]|jgi:hypothetical protein